MKEDDFKQDKSPSNKFQWYPNTSGKYLSAFESLKSGRIIVCIKYGPVVDSWETYLVEIEEGDKILKTSGQVPTLSKARAILVEFQSEVEKMFNHIDNPGQLKDDNKTPYQEEQPDLFGEDETIEEPENK